MSIRPSLWERVLAGYSKVAKTASPQRMLVSGHRGDRVRTPEQTMPAFVEAVRAGADAIELDVQWTKDQRMVLIHDWTVDRTTSSTGTVTDMTYAEIRDCDAGSWFGSQFRGAQVPAFEEVLAFAAKYRRLLINVEIKNPQLTEAQAQACLDALVAAGVAHRTIVSSFDPPALATFRSVDPQTAYPVWTDLPRQRPHLGADPGIRRHVLHAAVVEVDHGQSERAESGRNQGMGLASDHRARLRKRLRPPTGRHRGGLRV